MQNPRQEYTERLKERGAAAARFETRHRMIGNARLLVACAALAMAWIVIFRGTLSVWWLLVPAAAFIALAVVHARVLEAQRRALRAVKFYEAGLARMDDRWMGAGETGERFHNPAHPYAEDLDLFGRGSLFELLSAARTPAGEEMLAAWLCAPAPPDVVLARQRQWPSCGPAPACEKTSRYWAKRSVPVYIPNRWRVGASSRRSSKTGCCGQRPR